MTKAIAAATGLLFLSIESAFAWYDFKPRCGIPKGTPISERNFRNAERNIEDPQVILKAANGSGLCWIATLPTKDGAIDDERIICQRFSGWYEDWWCR